MINYIWTVNAMYTIQKPQPDYVVCALWTLTGADEYHNANVQSSTQFSVKQNDPSFVSYEDLTQDIVVAWIQSSLGADGIASFEANIAEQLSVLKDPQSTPQKTPLPWGN